MYSTVQLSKATNNLMIIVTKPSFKKRLPNTGIGNILQYNLSYGSVISSSQPESLRPFYSSSCVLNCSFSHLPITSAFLTTQLDNNIPFSKNNRSTCLHIHSFNLCPLDKQLQSLRTLRQPTCLRRHLAVPSSRLMCKVHG